MAEAQTVLLETREGTATVTLNRPDRRNALSADLVETLIETLERLKTDDDVRVIVLTGAGEKSFCAGGDLRGQQAGDGLLKLHESRGRFADLFHTMFGVGKPIIARVQGTCLGGGLGLMLACDLAVASEDATFGTPEIKVGLFPMMIMALIFRNVGRKKGMELILTGRRIDAVAAERLGLINQVVATDALDDAVDDLAARIGSFSPAVLRLGRNAVYDTMDMPMDEALSHLHAQLTLNTLLDDAAVGIGAFLTRSEPKWKGR
jgi:enoyl-CoA hydratase